MVNYKKLYIDFIKEKCPEKIILFEDMFNKDSLDVFDVIKLNNILFKENIDNQKFRSYSKESILKILDFQKKNKLNNTELSKRFKISRNTISHWKKSNI
jgi:hypothetical protein